MTADVLKEGGGSDAGPSSKQAQGPAQLTLSRVKAMIKEDADVKSISTEACFVVAKATERLLEAMADRAAQRMLPEGRAALSYTDAAHVVAEWRSLDFLDEIIPQMVPAAVVLARMEAAAEQPQQPPEQQHQQPGAPTEQLANP